MLKLTKVLEFHEFLDEFSYELRGIDDDAAAIIYDSLCEIMYDGDHSVDDVSDYIRFQVQVLSLDDVIYDYGHVMKLEGLEGDELVDAVVDHLNHHTYLLGYYEDDGITYFIFDEF